MKKKLKSMLTNKNPLWYGENKLQNTEGGKHEKTFNHYIFYFGHVRLYVFRYWPINHKNLNGRADMFFYWHKAQLEVSGIDVIADSLNPITFFIFN